MTHPLENHVATRRDILLKGAAIGAGAAMGLSSASAQTAFKFGHALPPVNSFSVGVEEAAAEVASKTQGRLKVQVFAGSTLGGDTDMLSQLRSGAIDMYALSPLVLATLLPVAAISGVPFAFRSYADVWKAMDGDLGGQVRAAADKAGIQVVGRLWDTGFRNFTSGKKPINGPQDLVGFKIRVPPSPMWVSTFKSLGAAPTTISFGEVYSALQTGIVDGMENSLAVLETSKFYEVQKHISLVNYMWDGMIVLANPRSLAKLSEADRETLKKSFDDAAVRQRAVSEKLNKDILEKLQRLGLQISRPDPESFKQALQKTDFYTSWRAKFGPEAWAVLEKYSGKLA